MAGIILTILIFNFLAVPEYRKLSEAKAEHSRVKSNALKQKEKLERLKTLPAFDVHPDTKDDAILVIKKVFERQKYQVTNITEGSDKIGNYLSFSALINNYSSIASVINYLDAISQMIPVKYISYEIINKNIKVNALCYIAHQ